MKSPLFVLIAIISPKESLWHHYSLEATPGEVDGHRLIGQMHVAKPPHPAFRQLSSREYPVNAATFMTLFCDTIMKYDPLVGAYCLMVMHSRRDVFDSYTLDRIAKSFIDHPDIDHNQVTVVHVVKGMPDSAMPFEEYLSQMHNHDDGDDMDE